MNKLPIMHGRRHTKRFAILWRTRQGGMIALGQLFGGKNRIAVMAHMILAKKQIHAPAGSLHDRKHTCLGRIGPIIQNTLRVGVTALPRGWRCFPAAEWPA